MKHRDDKCRRNGLKTQEKRGSGATIRIRENPKYAEDGRGRSECQCLRASGERVVTEFSDRSGTAKEAPGATERPQSDVRQVSAVRFRGVEGGGHDDLPRSLRARRAALGAAAWLACCTQEEIAEREGVTKETVSKVCQETARLPESDKPTAAHLVDFNPNDENDSNPPVPGAAGAGHRAGRAERDSTRFCGVAGG